MANFFFCPRCFPAAFSIKRVPSRRGPEISAAERLPYRRLPHRRDQPLLGDDAGDQIGGRHVEGRVINLDAVGGGLFPQAVGDLAGVALLAK